VPSVTSWRRKRNYVLGATTLIRPSDALPLETKPPADAPTGPRRCASPGCTMYAHSALSLGGGLYCCCSCQDKPGKHAASCEKCVVGESALPPEWALPQHGTIDIDVFLHLKLPVPTFLIPLTLIRWVVPRLVQVFYPRLIQLNELFGRTTFAKRVVEDSSGFYRAVTAQMNDPTRSYLQPGRGGPDGMASSRRFII